MTVQEFLYISEPHIFLLIMICALHVTGMMILNGSILSMENEILHKWKEDSLK